MPFVWGLLAWLTAVYVVDTLFGRQTAVVLVIAFIGLVILGAALRPPENRRSRRGR